MYISIGTFFPIIPPGLLPGEAARGWLSRVPLSEGLRGEGAWLPREQVAGLTFRRPGGQYLEALPEVTVLPLRWRWLQSLLGPFCVLDLLG